jgi:hypothetical protein
MTLAVGDFVRVHNNLYAETWLVIGKGHYVTVVHADGSIELEGMAGRFMAHRFEKVALVA